MPSCLKVSTIARLTLAAVDAFDCLVLFRTLGYSTTVVDVLRDVVVLRVVLAVVAGRHCKLVEFI